MEVRRGPFLDRVLDQGRGQGPEREEDGLEPVGVDQRQTQAAQGGVGQAPRPPLSLPVAGPPGIEAVAGGRERGQDHTHQEAGMQVGPEPQVWHQPEGSKPSAAVGPQPEEEDTGQGQVEHLRPGAPGSRSSQRAGEGQSGRRRPVEPGTRQKPIEADRPERHQRREQEDQERQATQPVDPVHQQVAEPFVHHPRMAHRRKGVGVDGRPAAQLDQQPAVGQVPPEVGVGGGHGRQAEDRSEEQEREQDSAVEAPDSAEAGADHRRPGWRRWRSTA